MSMPRLLAPVGAVALIQLLAPSAAAAANCVPGTVISGSGWMSCDGNCAASEMPFSTAGGRCMANIRWQCTSRGGWAKAAYGCQGGGGLGECSGNGSDGEPCGGRTDTTETEVDLGMDLPQIYSVATNAGGTDINVFMRLDRAPSGVDLRFLNGSGEEVGTHAVDVGDAKMLSVPLTTILKRSFDADVQAAVRITELIVAPPAQGDRGAAPHVWVVTAEADKPENKLAYEARPLAPWGTPEDDLQVASAARDAKLDTLLEEVRALSERVKAMEEDSQGRHDDLAAAVGECKAPATADPPSDDRSPAEEEASDKAAESGGDAGGSCAIAVSTRPRGIAWGALLRRR